MTWVWLLVGFGAIVSGLGTSERIDAMFEIAWKLTAFVLGFAILGMFGYDLAPSELHWPAATGIWAFLMVVTALWVRVEFPSAARDDPDC